MPTVYDQSHDLNGQELHRIMSVYDLPAFVKQASQQDICGGEDLTPQLFADTTRRRYPVHTGPATVISSIFFNEKKAALNPHLAQLIEDKLQKAAEYFKVTGYTRRLAEKTASVAVDDTALLPDSVFAIVFAGDDGVKERHYPMRNVQEVKKAAAWLQDRRDELPFADRRKVADKVLEKAANFGAGLPEHRYMLEKTAGLGACTSDAAAKLIRTRVYVQGHTHKPNEMQIELEKLACMCEANPQATQHYSSLTKIAEVVDQFDREHGLTHRYDDIIERPEDVLFAVTQKAAAEVDDSIIGNSLTGHYYKCADLQNLPVSALADNLGADFAAAVSTAGAWVDMKKLASIVPTLPLGDAELFDDVAAEVGISPFATKSAAVGKSISVAEQAALSRQHKPAPGSLFNHVR